MNHPTVQVGTLGGTLPVVRPMGLINGIFGCDGNNVGWICADYDDGRIIAIPTEHRPVK